MSPEGVVLKTYCSPRGAGQDYDMTPGQVVRAIRETRFGGRNVLRYASDWADEARRRRDLEAGAPRRRKSAGGNPAAPGAKQPRVDDAARGGADGEDAARLDAGAPAVSADGAGRATTEPPAPVTPEEPDVEPAASAPATEPGAPAPAAELLAGPPVQLGHNSRPCEMRRDEDEEKWRCFASRADAARAFGISPACVSELIQGEAPPEMQMRFWARDLTGEYLAGKIFEDVSVAVDPPRSWSTAPRPCEMRCVGGNALWRCFASMADAGRAFGIDGASVSALVRGRASQGLHARFEARVLSAEDLAGAVFENVPADPLVAPVDLSAGPPAAGLRPRAAPAPARKPARKPARARAPALANTMRPCLMRRTGDATTFRCFMSRDDAGRAFGITDNNVGQVIRGEASQKLMASFEARDMSAEERAGAVFETVDESPADWAQCAACDRWRVLPDGVEAASLPDAWTCRDVDVSCEKMECSVGEAYRTPERTSCPVVLALPCHSRG